MLKKVLASITILALFAIGIFFICNNKKLKIKMTVIKEAYNLVVSEGRNSPVSLYIQVYINHKDTYITDKEKMEYLCFCNLLEEEIYQINISEVNYLEKTKIAKETYYRYQFVVCINNLLQTDFFLEEAYLKVAYTNGKDIKVEIGSFSYYYDFLEIGSVSITNLKGIVSDINNKKTLTGIALNINNASKKEIVIKNIELLDLNMTINAIAEKEIQNISADDDIGELMNKEYYYMNTAYEQSSRVFKEDLSLIISIGYLKHYEISSVGIMIEYLENDILKRYYLHPFIFFNNYCRIINNNELIFYLYE